MFSPQEYVSLKDKTTFRMGGQARYFSEISNKEDVPKVVEFSRSKGLPLFILGKGSNCIFSEGVMESFFVTLQFLGKEIVEDNELAVLVKIGAGEVWDGVVSWAVEQGFSGIEAMSAIPGTAGATPVQNVGAYGQEIKDVLVEVEVYDTEKNVFVVLSNEECHFAYRASIFNKEEKGRYIIISMTLRLSKKEAKIPDYASVRDHFENNNIKKASLKDIREAVIAIRKEKLPDPSVIPNVGSFFKNVIIEENFALELKKRFSDLPTFPAGSGFTKISSGWLIEKAGLKGRSFGNVSVYDKNALVLTHNTKGDLSELLQTKDEIIEIVKNTFGVIMETEPLLIEK